MKLHIYLWKYCEMLDDAQGKSSEQIQGELRAALSADTDFRTALADLGASLAGEDSVLGELGVDRHRAREAVIARVGMGVPGAAPSRRMSYGWREVRRRRESLVSLRNSKISPMGHTGLTSKTMVTIQEMRSPGSGRFSF